MKNELKKRLIKDVENALNVNLTDSAKKDLERSFEISFFNTPRVF